jgi:hypothetical protein
MPAVRDAVFAQEAVTTDGGLTWPMCDYAENDLLFIFLFGDAAITSSSVTSAGTWNQLFIQNNTVGSVVFWKYATASEPAEVVVTAAPTDTYCGVLVSVRDAFQGYTSGSPPVKNNTTQASGTGRYLMPTISAQANSLILMMAANSSNNPTFVFGEGQGITQSIINGTAEGGSVGWFVQPTTGTTAAVPYASVAQAASVKAVIEVREPVGGATVIPAYCAADESVPLVINPGITWDGSTALAATADTNFGTSIGGVTANDATLATGVTDVGVDPKGFINAAGMTNAASTTAISGAEIVVPAGAYNIGDSNILAHIRSVTTIASQNLGAIGSTRGFWFGMRSGTTASTNYKIWQVHGLDAPYYGVGVVPIIINPADTNTRATAGTLSNTDVRRYGFWASGAGALTGQTILGPVWKMGTTTIAGGTSTEPINITGLEFALTKGKTRWSAIRQGANQMLCLQAVQFGDGGTNPVFLDLVTTAIEFPSRRNASAKLVNYNGPDNAIGFTYFAGASDTIKHRASVISSPSPYHWRIHADSSASATYDFNGLSVIGAGDVQLRPVTTFEGMSFTDCRTVTLNGASVAESSFVDSPVLIATTVGLSALSETAFSTEKTHLTNPYGIRLDGAAGTANLQQLDFEGFATSDKTLSANERLIPGFSDADGKLLVVGATDFLGASPYALHANQPEVVTAGAKYYGACPQAASWANSNSSGYELTGWNELPASQPYTIQFWLYRDGSSIGTISLLMTGSPPSSGALYTSNPYTTISTRSSGGTAFNINLSTEIPANQWVHIAIVRNESNQIRCYFDGVNVTLGGYTVASASVAAPGSFMAANNSQTAGRYRVQDFQWLAGTDMYGSSNFTPPGPLFKKHAVFVAATTGTTTLNVSGGTSPSVLSAGATVNIVSGATVTFTGLPTGTDVVILTAGTTTILNQVDQHPTSSYAWTYSGTPTVDVGFIKPGFKVRYLRNLALGSSDSSIPVELQPDAVYA